MHYGLAKRLQVNIVLRLNHWKILDPPGFEGGGINNAKDLATEALYINQNFRRQVLKRNEEPFKYEKERAPFEDETQDARAECAYKYRTWSLGNMGDGTPIKLVARTEIDGVMLGTNQEKQILTIKAFNEWDSQVDCRFNLNLRIFSNRVAKIGANH